MLYDVISVTWNDDGTTLIQVQGVVEPVAAGDFIKYLRPGENVFNADIYTPAARMIFQPDDALKFSQAACNAANAMCSLNHAKAEAK